VGKKCTAVWAADGQRYTATILKALGDGQIEVQYAGYPDKAIVNSKDVIMIVPVSSNNSRQASSIRQKSGKR